MPDNKSPWGPKGGSGGKKNPWGGAGKPDRARPGANDASPDLENVIEGFKSRVRAGGGGGGRRGGRPSGPIEKFGPFGLVAGAAAVFLVLSMFYTVDQTERAVVLRFGEYVRTEGPGLKFKLPSPVETKIVMETEVVQQEEIGDSRGQSLMLTGDENIVDIDFTVLWRIKDLNNFIFNVDETRNAVRAVGESAMREIVGKNELEKIITTDRLNITISVRDLMQKTLDEYAAGVEVVEVQLQKADPPEGEVVAAFRDVVNAAQDAETVVNQATAIQNDLIPRARGEAAQIIQDAEAYKGRVVAEAKGEAERFRLIYQEYKAAPVVTRQRMYLETIEQLYENSDKIVLDEQAGSGMVPYLPLNQLQQKQGAN
ncbi:FtsH protease activity modulator HflK [Litorimonas sp. RW-G-Af-16]|uniref:FtsH protease activity modulator HflK n=1 Tax=Litorimonas sp. RW-G-Af-16 TaxID=3241168 RepID=UPI00390C8148